MRIMGIHTTGSAVKNRISSEMGRELIAIYRTMYHLWFLIEMRLATIHQMSHRGVVPKTSQNRSRNRIEMSLATVSNAKLSS